MGRLIEADDAKKLICGIDSSFAYFVDMIPTAYNVEAVLMELKELENCTWKNCKWECDRPDSCLKCMVTQAIEIVKRGGRNELHTSEKI